ncbi:Localization factor PodJL [Acidithiobacillus thiooxidans ATCC 19377]|uniref:Localization factor PodJL n=1 Tax=Acidithiobacillus thiooxidans ATCC 19377 TaxID=637390 RepID=A0A543Q1J3_ACITH|nr:Localization factor PodJL [Acidithiobacillus thiooxidans ATCC 19377]
MFKRLFRKCIRYFAVSFICFPVPTFVGELYADVTHRFPVHVIDMPRSVTGMSLKRLEKWADAGDPAAENALGVHYFYGRGIPKNQQKADVWFRKSAESGNANGAFHLAFAYNFGEGVPANRQKAVYWWQQSAKDRKK